MKIDKAKLVMLGDVYQHKLCLNMIIVEICEYFTSRHPSLKTIDLAYGATLEIVENTLSEGSQSFISPSNSFS